MLISAKDIRAVRPLAANIPADRVYAAIREAQLLDLLPRVDAELYERLDNIGRVLVDENGNNLEDEDGEVVTALQEGDLTEEEYMFLHGGYYTDDAGVRRRTEGALLALCYFAWARLASANTLHITAYGVVTKEGDQSVPADVQRIATAVADARKVGEEYLGQALRYYRWATSTKALRKRRRFVAIGN